MREYMASIPPPPELSGEAYLILATHIFNPSAWVQIKMMRLMGCEKPIQFWYFAKQPPDIRFTTLPGVTFHKVDDLMGERDAFNPAVRTTIVKECGLRKVMILGCDVYPVMNVDFVFNDMTPMLCWQDHTTGDAWEPSIYGLRDEEPNYTIQGDTIGIDVYSAWKTISLANWFNENRDYYWQWGVKDQTTWRAACALTGVIPHRYTQGRVDASRGLIFVHHGHGGVPMFIHRTGNKFAPDGWFPFRLRYFNDLPFEGKAHDFYQEFMSGVKIIG